ncbi:sulfatase-like hydrolase/transferase [Pedobacter sp. LMG 31464]|uniref:Sulfatase-like hydrolase/transferase n=1 Tax=Pedobacter planticolens TaxID=2679964 RepID=A0A923DY05_9SPHI|nr:arylsulfatase [Pedobacter planticolens]MBB2145150.1 sulfatase-like hydrolase/transferase [Pedobacter planticolens]
MNKVKALTILCILICHYSFAQKPVKPNVIYIYADDLGYGDLSCYGAKKIQTPNIDKLAASGIRFTDGHATSATCTPSRYALMTGQYPWRKQGTGILPGDAALIIPTDKTTLPKLFKRAGYQTGIVGKWHLGLGEQVEKDWNGEIKPGPNEVGFDYSFIFPATADRVPTVFLENHNVIALDANDPIAVDYKNKVGNDPTGKEHPELLKLQSSPGQGHNQTIVNGIGRIGYMSGGKTARWVDEELSTTFLTKAQQFITTNQKSPFFLYFALTEPHVPRMPATMFRGKSGLGLRGDAILQLDWTVGQIMQQLKALNLDKNTIIIFTSDNGPVLDDGYQDEAVTKLNGHTPAGNLRGGKYSMLEAGTRVPFILSWPTKVKPQVSSALVSQMDLLASFSKLINQPIPKGDAPDSENLLDAFLGKSVKGRSVFIEQGGGLAVIKDGWKYIPASKGEAYDKLVGIETGNSPSPQLYNLKEDAGEKNNLAEKYPLKVKELSDILLVIKQKK